CFALAPAPEIAVPVEPAEEDVDDQRQRHKDGDGEHTFGGSDIDGRFVTAHQRLHHEARNEQQNEDDDRPEHHFSCMTMVMPFSPSRRRFRWKATQGSPGASRDRASNSDSASGDSSFSLA